MFRFNTRSGRLTSGCATLGIWLLALPPAHDTPATMRGVSAYAVTATESSALQAVASLNEEGCGVSESFPHVKGSTAIDAACVVPRLKRAFAAEGVPEQLVWIAEVESRFDQGATSRSGAAGLFQIMPDTARRFGLEVSARRDERRHPLKSATAAARYLRQLHSRFGSWLLAVAAYHAGEGRVERALEGAGSATSLPDALPETTRDYVDSVFSVVAAQEGVGADRLPPPCADR